MSGISNTLKRPTSDYIFKYMLEDFDGSATSAGYPLLCAIHLLEEEDLLVTQSKDVLDKDSSVLSN